MRAHLAMQRKHRRARAIVREGLTVLRRAWAARTLKRAIADVESTNAEDYRDFGLDKAEMLAALERLHAEIEREEMPAAAHGGHPRLAIFVTRRKPRLLAAPERPSVR